MTKLKSIDSRLITWTIMEGDEGCNVRSFCADGDGMVIVEEFANNVYGLSNEYSRLKFWYDVDTPEKLMEVLNESEQYLSENCPEVFERAMHWNNNEDKDFMDTVHNLKDFI